MYALRLLLRRPITRRMQHPGRHLVLLVDDDVDIRDAIADVLQEAGREVVTAADGDEALAKLASVARPCLILLDLMMPHVDGWEFLRRLSEGAWAQDLRVLVISAHGRAREAEVYPGVLGTMQKPFDVSELLTWVEAHC